MVKGCKTTCCIVAAALAMMWTCACFGCGVDVASVKLKHGGADIAPKTTELRSGVMIWDVSEVTSSNSGRDMVVNYGDSIISETINRHRIDYKSVGDSVKISYLRSPMTRIDRIDCPALPTRNFDRMTVPFTGRILCFNDELGVVSGTITRSFDGTGLFIGFEGDTIHNVSRTTDVFDLAFRFEVTEDFVRIERSRWLAPDNGLPFAVSERVCSRDSVGNYIENITYFSTVTSDELRRIKDNEVECPVDEDEILRMLDSVKVSSSGEVLNISGVLVDNHTLNVDIIDASGNHFGNRKFDALPTTMSLSGLLPGNYIVVLNVTAHPNLTVKRMFVKH